MALLSSSERLARSVARGISENRSTPSFTLSPTLSASFAATRSDSTICSRRAVPIDSSVRDSRGFEARIDSQHRDAAEERCGRRIVGYRLNRARKQQHRSGLAGQTVGDVGTDQSRKHRGGIDSAELPLDASAQAAAQRIADEQCTGEHGRTDRDAEQHSEVAAPVVEQIAGDESGQGEHGSGADEGAVVHFGSPREELRQVGAVRDHDENVVLLPVQFEQKIADRLRVLAVEVAGRLVGEKQHGLEHERARDRDALPLAAGELRRPVIEPAGQVRRDRATAARRLPSRRACVSRLTSVGTSTFSSTEHCGSRW